MLYGMQLPTLLPPSYLKPEDLKSGKGKGKRKEQKSYVINNQILKKWSIPDRETFLKMFPKSYLYKRPDFNGSSKICYRWPTRGYCFLDCSAAVSHGLLCKKKEGEFDVFFKKGSDRL